MKTQDNMQLILFNDIEKEAIELRKSGWTQKQICDKLKIARSTLRYWIKNIVITPEQKHLIKVKAGVKWSEISRIKRLQKL